MKTVLLINGPNLGILGKRQTHIYGKLTLIEIVKILKKNAKQNNIHLQDFQNNVEGEIVSFLNNCFIQNIKKNPKKIKSNIIGIIINPAAYSHTSIAIRDALEIFNCEKIPIFEVHISNIFSREEFRHKSYISAIATGVISGLGTFGYEVALNKIIEMEKNNA